MLLTKSIHMKTKLLLIAIIMMNFAIGQNLVISEIMVNPSGTDVPHEYIELRGDPGATIAAGTYLIQVEGDSSDPGDLESNGDATNGCTVNNDGMTPCPQGGIIDLSGVTIGSNGYVVLLNNGHDYDVNPNATILLDYTDGDLEGQSHSFLLINTNGNAAPDSGDDIDDDNDGEIDVAFTSIWTFIDGVSFIDDDATTGEGAYGNVIFAESAAVSSILSPASSIVISTDTQYDYAARIGNSTGSFVDNDASNDSVDWVGGDVPSSTTSPRLWNLGSNMSAVRTHPESWEGSFLNHIGGPNPTMNTLSDNNFEAPSFAVYPNPVHDILTIETNTQISSVHIFDILGKEVMVATRLDNGIDFSTLKSGVYILKIIANDKSVIRKILKE